MWLILLSLLLYSPAQADDTDGVSLREVYIDYTSYFPGGTDPILVSSGMPDRHLDKRLNLHVNMDLLNYIYWENMINSTTDKDSNGSGQFRVVGWEFGFGIRFLKSFRAGYYHHSQHLLDYQGQYHYPVEDGIQVRLTIFSRPEGNGLLNF